MKLSLEFLKRAMEQDRIIRIVLVNKTMIEGIVDDIGLGSFGLLDGKKNLHTIEFDSVFRCEFVRAAEILYEREALRAEVEKFQKIIRKMAEDLINRVKEIKGEKLCSLLK